MRWMRACTSRGRATALSSVALLAASLLGTAMASGAETQMVFGALDDSIMTSNDRPSLADALTINPELGIFYSYLRESTSLVCGARQP